MMQRTELDTSASSASRDRDGQAGRFRYRAFISYSHEDQPWADWLIKALETYRVPARLVDTVTAVGTVPKRLTPIFRDRDEMASASDLGDTIRAALSEAASLIVICSPASANSHWVNEEIRAFQNLGRGHRIFCLIVAGEPNASALSGQEYKECLAPSLRGIRNDNAVPVAHFIEPAAADVRPGMDSRANARLKLVAGLLGLSLHDLRQRDQQRHLRRLIAITVLALVVTATTTTLAIAALMARQSAQAAQQAAERRQKQAESLVDFMLGDLNDKLREVNRLDILESVDDKAMAYFTSLPVEDVTDQSLALRAKALVNIGTVRMDQGHNRKALDAFELARIINRQRLNDEPSNVQRLTDYGASLTWLGNLNLTMKDAARAERAFRESVDVLDRALAAQPDNPETKLQLAYAYNNLAYMLSIRNKSRQAVAMHKKQIALLQQLHDADPDNPTYAQSLAVTGMNVASLDFEHGQLVESIADQIAPNQVLSRMTMARPDDRRTRIYYMMNLANLAYRLHAAGKQQSAIRYMQIAVDISDALVRFDPTHVDWKTSQAAYGTQLIRWQLESDPSSRGAIQQLLALDAKLNDLRKKHPDTSALTRWQASLKIALAGARLDAGRVLQARELASNALSSLGSRSGDLQDHDKEARIACEGELLLARMATDDRLTHARRALDLIQPIAKPSGNPSNRSLWVEALLENGRQAQAMPIIRNLQDMGYRTPGFMNALARWKIQYPPDPNVARRLDAVVAELPPLAATTHATPTKTASTRP